MKKIIFLTIIGLILSGTVYAESITPGRTLDQWGQCTVWREGMSSSWDTKSVNISWCGNSNPKEQEIYNRLHELEIAVQELQNKVNVLESNCQVAGNASTPSTSLLELRVQSLESTVATLQESISNSLKTILSFLMIKK